MHRSHLHFLDDIREACGNILTYTKGMLYQDFAANRLIQDAVIRNFEVIGEAVKNLPEDFKTRYPSVAWKQIAGLRDILAHGYFRVDHEVVWGIITERIPSFKKDITKIIREEEHRGKNKP